MTNGYRIALVDVRHFKRIDHVRIEPDADTNLLLIAGQNAAGKSSLLDAMTLLLGGGRELPAEPIRHGKSSATIEGELVGVGEVAGVKYTVTRHITKNGQRLEIVGPDGPIKSPQTWLNKLIGSRFLDPLSFLTMPAKEQRKLLLEVCGVNVDAIEAERAKAFATRTDVNRDLAKAKGEYERLPAPAPSPGEARAMSTITGEIEQVAAEQRHIDAARSTLATRRRETEAAEQRVRQLQAELDDAKAKYESRKIAETEAADLVRRTATIEQEQSITARIAELRAEAQRAETFARWQAGKAATDARRKQAELAIEELDQRSEMLTETIKVCERRKADALSAAKMPVANLEVDDDGLRLGGVPFDQASQSERLRCALGVAERLSPGLRDVWVRDGSLLDDAALDTLRELADAADCRIWIERVGERDPGAIVIREGAVVDAST